MNPTTYFSYHQVTKDEDGWVDASLFLPADYDLLYLKIKGKKGTIRGWISGHEWDGLKYKSGDVVELWKKSPFEEEIL
jgi:hypothetical protein